MNCVVEIAFEAPPHPGSLPYGLMSRRLFEHMIFRCKPIGFGRHPESYPKFLGLTRREGDGNVGRAKWEITVKVGEE